MWTRSTHEQETHKTWREVWNICDAFLILKNLILSFKNKVNFIFTAQYHKSQIAFRGFTVCTADDALCPQSLESDQDKTF